MTRADNSIRIDFSRIDVVDFLEELGLRNVEDKGLEVFYSCPFPGHSHEDTNPSASMKQGSTVAYCFGCGWRGNALRFLSDYEGVSPVVAAHWIRQRFGDDFQEPEGTFLEEMDTILAGSKKREDEINGVLDDYESYRRQLDWNRAVELILTDGPLAEVPVPMWYMLEERGFSAEILTKFEIGFDTISQRIVIPYRNELGQLIGFKARAFMEGQLPRYWTLGGPEYGFKSFNVSQALWGLPVALESKAYQRSKQGIVVEGELNALSLHQRGFDNSVGISGKVLSNRQVELVKEYFSSVLFIFDETEDALKAAEKMYPFMPVYLTYDHDKDPASMSDLEVTDLVTQPLRLMDLILPSD